MKKKKLRISNKLHLISFRTYGSVVPNTVCRPIWNFQTRLYLIFPFSVHVGATPDGRARRSEWRCRLIVFQSRQIATVARNELDLIVSRVVPRRICAKFNRRAIVANIRVNADLYLSVFHTGTSTDFGVTYRRMSYAT